MITFTATTLSGVQQPQFSHSFPQEGSCLASTERRGPPEITPRTATGETQPWVSVHVCTSLFPLANECHEAPLRNPLLWRISRYSNPPQRGRVPSREVSREISLQRGRSIHVTPVGSLPWPPVSQQLLLSLQRCN